MDIKNGSFSGISRSGRTLRSNRSKTQKIIIELSENEDGISSDEEVYGSDTGKSQRSQKFADYRGYQYQDTTEQLEPILSDSQSDQRTDPSMSPTIEKSLTPIAIQTPNVTEPNFQSQQEMSNFLDVSFMDDMGDHFVDYYDGNSDSLLEKIKENFFKKSTKPPIVFCKAQQSKDIKKMCNILNDANIEFTTDLPLHLYSTYLLSTRNTNLPASTFTLWPLPSDELITPRAFLRTTTTAQLGLNANDLKRELDKTKFTFVNYDQNNIRLKPKSHMLEFWHPQINALTEIDECLDAIFERKINSQIRNYADKHKLTKKGFPIKNAYQRRTPEDLHLNPLLKKNIINKLDSVIDQLSDMHTNSMQATEGMSYKLKKYYPGKLLKVPNYGLDWLSVLSCLDHKDKKSKLLLLKLFNLKLDKDNINGPVNSYPIDYELYCKPKLHRDKILKRIMAKHKIPAKNLKSHGHVKQAKKKQNHIRYNMDSFLDLALLHRKDKRLNEKKLFMDKFKTDSE